MSNKAARAGLRRRYRDGFPRKVREIVKERSMGICEIHNCGMPALQMHHRRPRAMGGSKADDTNTASNALHICLNHHAWIESRRTEACEVGQLLESWQSPVEVPVVSRHGVVLLADDGTYRAVDP